MFGISEAAFYRTNTLHVAQQHQRDKVKTVDIMQEQQQQPV